MIIENLYPNTQYNFQLRASFKNSKNEKELSLPVFSVETTCPSSFKRFMMLTIKLIEIKQLNYLTVHLF